MVAVSDSSLVNRYLILYRLLEGKRIKSYTSRVSSPPSQSVEVKADPREELLSE